jgi:hypothetical protein
MDVVMKIVARMTVVRVNAFAAPRPVINPPTPPPEPKPRPPPSERCRRMMPIIATHTTIWMVNRTGNKAVIGAGSSKRGAKVLRLKKARFVAEPALDDHPSFLRQRRGF